MSIIAACMPSLGGVLRMQAPKLKSTLAFSRPQNSIYKSATFGSHVTQSAVHKPQPSMKMDPEGTWIKLEERIPPPKPSV